MGNRAAASSNKAGNKAGKVSSLKADSRTADSSSHHKAEVFSSHHKEGRTAVTARRADSISHHEADFNPNKEGFNPKEGSKAQRARRHKAASTRAAN